MTRDVPGLAPDHDYEPSYCNQALEAAGLDIQQPNTLALLSRTLPAHPWQRDTNREEPSDPNCWTHLEHVQGTEVIVTED